jgi:hypothetical protein
LKTEAGALTPATFTPSLKEYPGSYRFDDSTINILELISDIRAGRWSPPEDSIAAEMTAALTLKEGTARRAREVVREFARTMYLREGDWWLRLVAPRSLLTHHDQLWIDGSWRQWSAA